MFLIKTCIKVVLSQTQQVVTPSIPLIHGLPTHGRQESCRNINEKPASVAPRINNNHPLCPLRFLSRRLSLIQTYTLKPHSASSPPCSLLPLYLSYSARIQLLAWSLLMARFQGCQAAFLSHQHSVFEVLFLRCFSKSLSLYFLCVFSSF